MFKRFLTGELVSYRAAAREIGVSYQTARNLLTHPIYGGWLVQRYRYQKVNGTQVKVPIEPPIKVDLVAEGILDAPLISRSDWYLIQQKVEERSRTVTRTRQESVDKHPHAYKSFLCCAMPGSRLWAFKAEKKYDWYVWRLSLFK